MTEMRKQNTCDVCGQSFNSENERLEHQRKAHAQPQSRPGSGSSSEGRENNPERPGQPMSSGKEPVEWQGKNNPERREPGSETPEAGSEREEKTA